MSTDFSSLVYYAPDSPTGLRWLVDIRNGWYNSVVRMKKDSVAGSLTSWNYYEVSINSKSYKVHRVIWALHHGAIQNGLRIDHIDGVRTNNLIQNLRLVSHAVNCRNIKMRTTNTSGVTGVSKTTKGNNTYWISQVVEDGKHRSKWFNCNMGDDIAFQLACAHRKLNIELINSTGAGYTERHGT